MRFDPEQTDGSALGEGFIERVGRERPRADGKPARVRRVDEAGRIRQHRSPRLPPGIHGTHDHERKLAEEFAMLLRHELAKYVRAGRSHPLAYAHARLHLALAFVE